MPAPDEVLIALRRIIRATDQNSKRLNRTAGLTIPQSVLMHAIETHPDATLSFLTETVSLSQATVTSIVDRLEERGLLVRRRNANDKRVINVSLTARGKELLRDAPPPLQQDFRERFYRLPEVQQTAIVGALDAVAAMMDARDIEASPILTLGKVPEHAVVAGAPAEPDWRLREPESTDGARVHELVRVCPPLDQNSLYCNLLQTTHFRDTSIIAERAGSVLGFVSGYLLPSDPSTLFVWQVAVHPTARNQRLGARMLDGLLAREALSGVRYLETTITPGNEASSRLFESFARARSAAIARETLFDRDRHFGGSHASEVRTRIGPFDAASATRNASGPRRRNGASLPQGGGKSTHETSPSRSAASTRRGARPQ